MKAVCVLLCQFSCFKNSNFTPLVAEKYNVVKSHRQVSELLNVSVCTAQTPISVNL